MWSRAQLLHLCAPPDPRSAPLGHHRRQGRDHTRLSRAHSCYAVAAFHEALRILLSYGRRRKASDYAYHEKALRQTVEARGREVTSNMTKSSSCSIFPASSRARRRIWSRALAREDHGIWTTLSEPVQIRIGILNQLTPEAITEIVGRFADAMLAMGAEFDKQKVMNGLKTY